MAAPPPPRSLGHPFSTPAFAAYALLHPHIRHPLLHPRVRHAVNAVVCYRIRLLPVLLPFLPTTAATTAIFALPAAAAEHGRRLQFLHSIQLNAGAVNSVRSTDSDSSADAVAVWKCTAIVEAYKKEPGNIKYAFKHLLFSVTEPQIRTKPAGISDIMWAEAIGKLEGMESSNRERLWPQLVMGFKDLSLRLKLQDEVIHSDAERLKMTQSNVKLLQRHFQAETLPRIERMRQQEQGLQRRLLRVMRVVEALEGKGFRLPLMKGEVELAEKLAAITRQLRGSGAELSRRVQNLRTISHLGGGSAQLPGSAKIHEQSLADMQEVLQQQTEAIARLANVLKRDTRDMEIIMAEDTQMSHD
ncbi:hypothetical protein RJ639_029181 [Escallonia herrerae]|uniref:Nucleoporin Nup54 alpha-helical domain-containing protein n=1 Tax=Escallonia herrerae TaxID=1293975 RepID=A0AA88X6N0_9ASTE|nr:hypothetical protein RJ639_029181 [Escallonia herrerae]